MSPVVVGDAFGIDAGRLTSLCRWWRLYGIGIAAASLSECLKSDEEELRSNNSSD
jgi:uncharacterized protein with PIN domain